MYLRFQAKAGPLVRVLASEALRLESPLAAMRQELIERTVELYVERFAEVEGRAARPDAGALTRADVGGANLHMITTTPGAEEDVEQVRRVLHHVVRRALATDGLID